MSGLISQRTAFGALQHREIACVHHTLRYTDAPSVQRNGDVSVSQVGIDKGSSFNLVSCARCGTPVGRTYLTTSGQLDAARGAIALLASNVTMYKLGAGPDVDTMAEHAGIASHMARLQVTESNVVGLRETCDFLAEQVAKLQTVVLLLHEQQEAPHQGVTSAVSSKSSSSRGSGDSRDRAAASSPADTPPKSSKRKGTKRPRERGGASATKGVSSHQGKRSMSSAPSPAAASGGGMTSLSALASPGGAGGSKHSSGGSGSALASFLSSPRGLAALNSPPPAPPASKSGSSKKGKRRIAPQLVSPV